MGPEATIEHHVCQYARANGWLVWKFTSPRKRGVPDRLFLSPTGVYVLIEFKDLGEKPTALQQREIDLINRNHGNAYWVDNIKRGIEILESFQKL